MKPTLVDDVFRLTAGAFRLRSKAEGMWTSHRGQLADAVRVIGVREIARRTGLTPMRVSRFVAGSATHDAATFYVIAAAAGYLLDLRRRV